MDSDQRMRCVLLEVRRTPLVVITYNHLKVPVGLGKDGVHNVREETRAI